MTEGTVSFPEDFPSKVMANGNNIDMYIVVFFIFFLFYFFLIKNKSHTQYTNSHTLKRFKQ